jgi:hypothetical protein
LTGDEIPAATDEPTAQPTPPFDYQKWVHEMKRADAYRVHDQAEQFYNSINERSIASAELVLRTCILINGGAAVAVLAFLGSLVSKSSNIFGRLTPVTESLVKFAIGIAAAVAAMGVSYGVHYLVGMHVRSQERLWEHPFIETGASRSFGRASRSAAICWRRRSQSSLPGSSSAASTQSKMQSQTLHKLRLKPLAVIRIASPLTHPVRSWPAT